ncbi:hypothetical protein AAG906_005265 [Vitis piasezkii]
MRLWCKCWQVPGIYGQPERHRSQPGSSQGSHGNTPSQEQEGATTPHRQARRTRVEWAIAFSISRPSPKEQKPIYYAESIANSLSSSKCCPKAPPLFPSPPSNRIN